MYARADEFLRFPTGGVHIRELVKYPNYKALASRWFRFCLKSI